MAAMQYSHACVCGKPFKVFASSGLVAKRCSDHRCVDCGACIVRKATRCRKCEKITRRIPTKTYTCLACGVNYIPQRKRSSGEGGKYCSRACSDARRWRNVGQYCRVFFRECEGCGKLCTFRHGKRVRCTDCPKKKYYQGRPDKQCKCKQCGATFIAPYIEGKHHSDFCSDSCKEKCAREKFLIWRRNWRRKKRKEEGRTDKYRKRARLLGVAYEYIDRVWVLERDGWRCQMCGKPTPKKRSGTRHHNAPELDHRIPLARGGPHLYSNVQCACRACNAKKNAKYEAGQLPLFNPTKSKTWGAGSDSSST